MKKEKPVNEMKTVFPSCSANESFARAAAAAFLAQLDPTLEELNDVRTAVSEAVTNCIVHGYRDTLGQVTLILRFYEGRRVSVTVRDRGCGIPDVPLAMEPLYTTGGAERAGLGFAGSVHNHACIALIGYNNKQFIFCVFHHTLLFFLIYLSVKQKLHYFFPAYA